MVNNCHRSSSVNSMIIWFQSWWKRRTVSRVQPHHLCLNLCFTCLTSRASIERRCFSFYCRSLFSFLCSITQCSPFIDEKRMSPIQSNKCQTKFFTWTLRTRIRVWRTRVEWCLVQCSTLGRKERHCQNQMRYLVPSKYVQCVICLDIYRPLVEVFASGLRTPSVEEKEKRRAKQESDDSSEEGNTWVIVTMLSIEFSRSSLMDLL